MPGFHSAAVHGALQGTGRRLKGALVQELRGSSTSVPPSQARPSVLSRALLERRCAASQSPSQPLSSWKDKSWKASQPRLTQLQQRSSPIVAYGSSEAAAQGHQRSVVSGQDSKETESLSVCSEPASLQLQHAATLPSSTADAGARRKTLSWPWSRVILMTSAALCVAAIGLFLSPHSAIASSSSAAAAPTTGAGGAGAVAEATIAKSSIGIKIANWLRGHLGWMLADEAIVVLVAALPVVELRGAIPVAFWLGMSTSKAFWLSVLGNMIPVPFILLYLGKVRSFLAARSERLRSAMDWFLDYTRGKAAPIEEFKFLGIMLFVGVPLPGTGAWSGAICSYLLSVSFWEALFANFFGVLIAGGIVCAMCLSGPKQAAFLALNLFLVSGGMWSLVRAGIKVANAVGHRGTP